MSIEYQLYQMATTNQIIIPTCSNPSLPPPLPPTTAPYSFCTPRKQPSLQHTLPWKKTHSAFKKFREKKDRKTAENAPEPLEPENAPSQQPSRKYKLATPRPPVKQIQQFYQSYFQCQPPYGYYDPNLAPLHRYAPSESSPTDILPANQPHKKKLPKATLKKQEEPSQIRSLKIQPLPSKKSEQNESEPSLMIAEDDPFIIVRRYSVNKSNKSLKTKYIKKQKIQKDNSPHSHLRINSIPRIHSQSALNNEQMAAEGQAPGPGFIPPITLKKAGRPSCDVIEIESSSCQVIQSEEEQNWQPQQFIECD